MDMSILPTEVANAMTPAAKAAVEAGQGLNKIYGGTFNGINVGDVVKLVKWDYLKDQWLPKNKLTTDESKKQREYVESIKDLIDETQATTVQKTALKWLKDKCVLRSWYTFITDNNNVSFTTFLGHAMAFTEGFWDEPEKDANGNPKEPAPIKSDDFDVDRLFKPNCRKLESWISGGMLDADGDCVLGRKFKLVGIREVTIGAFDTKVYAWMPVD